MSMVLYRYDVVDVVSKRPLISKATTISFACYGVGWGMTFKEKAKQ